MTEEKILVVEDDYVLAASLDADLKAMGYHVVGLASSADTPCRQPRTRRTWP